MIRKFYETLLFHGYRLKTNVENLQMLKTNLQHRVFKRFRMPCCVDDMFKNKN